MTHARHAFWAVIALGSIGISPLARGQTIFEFSNIRPGRLNAPVFDATGVPLSGTNYLAILFGGPSADSLAVGWDYTTRAPMAPEPFTFTALGGGHFTGDIVEIPSVNCGGIATLQVRAWDARLGASYEEVVALGGGGYGASPIFQKQGGNPCFVNPTAPEALIGLQSFSLVPEPSSLFLVALGLPLLILFLRRRSRRAG